MSDEVVRRIAHASAVDAFINARRRGGPGLSLDYLAVLERTLGRPYTEPEEQLFRQGFEQTTANLQEQVAGAPDPSDLRAVQQYSEDVAKRGLPESLAYVGSWNNMLFSDVLLAMKLAKEKEEPFADGQIEMPEFLFYVRTVVHVFFANVEGLTFTLRQVALWAHERGEFQLTEREQAKLQERDPETGKPQYIPMRESLGFSYQMFSRALGIDVRIDRSGEGWRHFNTLLDARHKVTHPKGIDSFTLGLDVLAALNAGIPWLLGEMSRLMQTADEAARRRREGQQT